MSITVTHLAEASRGFKGVTPKPVMVNNNLVFNTIAASNPSNKVLCRIVYERDHGSNATKAPHNELRKSVQCTIVKDGFIISDGIATATTWSKEPSKRTKMSNTCVAGHVGVTYFLSSIER